MDLLNSKDFAEHVDKVLEEWHTPAVSIAILQDGKPHSKAFGKASLDPSKPATPDTLYDIASSSKSITAATVALLVADDENFPKVQWGSKMSDLLPEEFVMSEESYTKDVTVEDILSHRTGLPGHDDSYLSIRAKQPDTIKTVTENLRNLQIATPIRTKFMYCNMMFTVATYLVEKLTGRKFADFLHERILDPLDMSSTHVTPDSTIAAGLKDRMAIQYAWINDKMKEVDFEQSPESIGAGSIFTSAVDYLKYVKALMNQEPPFTEDMYKDLTKPRIIAYPEDDIDDGLYPLTSPVLYALGWEVTYYRGHKIVKHDGQIAASGSVHFFMPQLKFAGVLLLNSDQASNVGEILAKELIDEVLGIPKDERLDWNAVEGKIIEQGKAKFKERTGENLKKKIWPEYDGRDQSQTVPLEKYCGEYWSPVGYHGMTVEVKDGKLFVDGSDRTMSGTFVFEHVCEQKKYIAHLYDFWYGPESEADQLVAEFEFEGEEVVRMGIELDNNLEGLIWFDKKN